MAAYLAHANISLDKCNGSRDFHLLPVTQLQSNPKFPVSLSIDSIIQFKTIRTYTAFAVAAATA